MLKTDLSVDLSVKSVNVKMIIVYPIRNRKSVLKVEYVI